jgi:hypothetical protein
MRDHIKNTQISPEGEFPYFSLEKASENLNRSKRNAANSVESRVSGHAKRKKAEAEVTMIKGNGKVTINGE